MKMFLRFALLLMTLFLEGGLVYSEEEEPSFVVAPAVSSSPGFGNGLGVVGLMFFRPDAEDDVSPNSTLTAIGLYSDTDSYFTGLFVPLYLKEDTYRVTPGVVHGRVKSSLEVGLPEPARFDNTFVGTFLKVLRQVQGPWYAGGQVMFIANDYSARNAAGAAYFERFEIEDTTSGTVSFVVAYDTRDDQRYPSSGQNGELTVSYAPEAWVEDGSYTTAALTASSFHTVAEQTILAFQTYGRTVSDDAPYFERPTLGQRGDLRGYTPGEIVGDHSLSAQVEVRHMFTDRIGGVVFGGLSGIWESGFTSDDLYESYGAGVRFRIQKENKVNFRVDYAVGEDDQNGWYISVSEAF